MQRILTFINGLNDNSMDNEYLFGTPPDGSYSGSVGQFNALEFCKNVTHVVIDEAHKTYD